MKPLSRWITASLLSLSCLLAPSARAAAAVELLLPGLVFESAPYTLGFAFRVKQTVDLVALGVFDFEGDGLEAPAEVALWHDGNPVEVLGTTVPGGTQATLDGGFRYAGVQPYRLVTGQVYVVAAYLDGGWGTSVGVGQGGEARLDDHLDLLADRYGDGFFHITYASETSGLPGLWLGANFQLAPVPEPAGAALWALGLAALALRVWRA